MVKNNNITTVIITALGLSLSACGGSDNETQNVEVVDASPSTSPSIPPNRSLTVTGKAIDGYIAGGIVFLDINGNGIAESTEPQKVTEEGGDYSLVVPEADAECLSYSALIVDVPAGAWDEGSEEENVEAHEVTEPYQITLQPTFEPITEQDFTNGLIRNISPLTTVVWELIERNYPPFVESKDKDSDDISANAKHCHYLKEHNEAVVELKQEIEISVNELVTFYNLSADQIYTDFIANNDSNAFHAAQVIMQGLKAAYKHKTKLREQNPDAKSISVFVYRDKVMDEFNNNDQGWYRQDYINLGNEDYFETYKLSDDASLDVIDFDIMKLHEVLLPWNGADKQGLLSVRTDITRQHIDDKAEHYYSCGTIERLSFEVNNIHYELGNSSDSGKKYPDTSECNNELLAQPFERSHHVSYNVNDVRYSATFYFRQAQSRFGDLSDWIDFQLVNSLDTQEVINLFNTMPYRWDDNVMIDTFFWRKRKEEGNLVIETDSDNNWQKSALLEDGTRTYECSSDGVNWSSCE
jgi:hypothetical protein